MKNTKTLSLLLAALMLLCLLPACGETSSSSSIVDMEGRSIKLDKPAERVIALSAADCDIIYALGAMELLVGRGEYCDYPPEVLDIPAVQSGAQTNIEQIIALEPDVLFMSSMDQSEEQVAALENAGITTVVSDADNIEEVYTSIKLIGAVLGRDAEAEALVSSMKGQLDELRLLSAGDGTETVYFEVSPLEWGLWTAGSDTFMNEVAELLGLKNIFADLEGWAEVSQEQVIERNPDYIVTITMYFDGGELPEEEILSRAGWENITAVKNRAVLRMQNNELSRPSQRLVEGARMLYDFVYGTAEADKAA